MEKSGKRKNSAAPELQVEAKGAAPVLGAGNYTEDRGTLAACKKRPRTGKYSAFIIPIDIIFKILLLVPARVLLETVRFVCKEWNAIITDPLFISAHLLHLLSSSPGNIGIIVQDQDRHDAKLKRAFYLHPDKTMLYRPTELQLPIPAAILGSCNGLVLLHSATNRRVLLVVNLLTKAKISLPPLVGVHIIDRPFTTLAFAPSSGQYKVVYVSFDSKKKRAPYASAKGFYSLICGFEVKVIVCTVGVDETWRAIDCKSITQSSEGRRSLLSSLPLSSAGFIYWFNDPYCNYGLALDVNAETLHPFAGPKDYVVDCNVTYSIKMDTGGVGVVHDEITDDGICIWKFWELIEPKSGTWGRAMDVNLNTDDMYWRIGGLYHPSCTIGPARPLLISLKTEELWLSCPVDEKYALVCYNWKTGYLWSLASKWPGHLAVPHLHLNSLLSLKKESLAVE